MKHIESKYFFDNMSYVIAKVLNMTSPSACTPDDFYPNFVDRICYYKYPRGFDSQDTLLGSFGYYFTNLSKYITRKNKNISLHALCNKHLKLKDLKTNNWYFYEEMTRHDNVIEFWRILYHEYFLNAVYRFCRRFNVFTLFYYEYVKDYIELANSNNFLNHSSCDAIILPLESAIYNLMKNEKLFKGVLFALNKYIVKDSRFINLIDNNVEKHPKIRLSSLLSDWDIKSNYVSENDKLTGATLRYMLVNALVTVLIYGIVSSLGPNKRIVKNKKLRLLAADINLYFTRYTTNILTNVSILKEFTALKDEYEDRWNIIANTYKPNFHELWDFNTTTIRFHELLNPVSEYYFSCKGSNKEAETTINLIRAIKESDKNLFFDKENRYIHGTDFGEKFNNDEKYKNNITDKIYFENHMILFNLVKEEAKKMEDVAHNKLNFKLTDFVFEQIGERLKKRQGQSFMIPSFFFEYYTNKNFYL